MPEWDRVREMDKNVAFSLCATSCLPALLDTLAPKNKATKWSVK